MLPSATHLKAWHDGETLYSLCARHHHIAGNAIAATTSRQLFGTPRAAAHDFPLHLNEFVARLGPTFGTPEEIALRRTILPFYFHLRPLQARLDALAALSFGGCGPLKASLGSLASRFGAAHPLKTCLQCRAIDGDSAESWIWRLEHQWPGVWTCFRCGSALHWTTERVHGGNRFAWLLPADCQFREGLSSDTAEHDLRALRSFTQSVLAYASTELDTEFDLARIHATYRKRLDDMGLRTPSGRVDVAGFTAHMIKTTASLAKTHELATLPTTEEQVEAQFLRFIRGTVRPAHPLRHLALIHTLFGGWDAWRSAYASASVPDTRDLEREQLHSSADPRRAKFLLLLSEGNSVSSTSRMIGIAAATGIAWATAAGIATPRRPSLLKPERRAAAIALLLAGGSKAAAAKAAGVSLPTINMLLKSEIDLRRAWHSAMLDRTQREYRLAWTTTASRLRNPSRKQLRALQPAVFMWLYRNDRAWLETFSSALTLETPTTSSRVDWDRRDQDFAHAVQVARDALSKERSGKAIRVADLCDRVPGLKARLSQLDQLPLTRDALGRRRHASSASNR